jgi:GAF domain-containing protein
VRRTSSHAAAERERQHALDRYHLVDTPAESVYDDLVRIAARLCGTPNALLSLVDRERQWFKARIGLSEPETPRNMAVCAHAIRTPGELMEVQDLARDPRFASFPTVIGEVRARFYASMPLVTGDGQAIGTLCVVDRQPRTLDPEQREWLKSLARIAMGLLDGHARRHQEEVAAALQEHEAPAEAAGSASKDYWIAILEVQRHAQAVERMGERTVEKALRSLEIAFEACLDPGAGDRVNRVTSSAEFVATVVGDGSETRLDALREVAAGEAARSGVTVLAGCATSEWPDEPVGAVFLRADAGLSRLKDEGAVAGA